MSHTLFRVSDLPFVSKRRSAILDALTGPVHAKQDHDMRNFLYLSSSFAQLLHDGLVGPVSQSQKEFLGHILDCAAKAQALLAPPLNAASRVRQ